MKKSFQVLFNRPLQFEDGVIYGVRVPYDETKAKHLMDYAVEWLIGKWCFTQKHEGKVEDITKWIDSNSNIYSSWTARRLYSYTAALATQTYFRIDEWRVDDDRDLLNEIEITAPNEYFNTRCILEEQERMSIEAGNRKSGCPKLISDEGVSIGKEDDYDELSS